jgi:hypothetical protein
LGKGVTATGVQAFGGGATTCTGAQTCTRSHAPIPALATLQSPVVSAATRPANSASPLIVLFRLIEILLCEMKHSMEQTVGQTTKDACP